MDRMKRIPISEQDPKKEQKISKKYALVILKTRRYRKHQDACTAKNLCALLIVL